MASWRWRNVPLPEPMYLGWTLAYAGIGLVMDSGWLLLLLPAVLVMMHVTVLREERGLGGRLTEYGEYKARVRRYL